MRQDVSDAELLRSLATPNAFAEFYDRHFDAVLRFAERRCRQPADVADLVSMTFLEAARSAASFDGARGGARAWLVGIARHCLIDLHRHEVRQRLLLERLDDRVAPSPDEYAAIERRIDAAALAPPLRAALALLTERERDLFELVAFDELSAAEAARILGLAPVAARMRLARARRRLRTALRDSAADSRRPVFPSEETT